MADDKVDSRKTLNWITSRYGQVTFQEVTIFIATVPTYKGATQGVGTTKEQAVEALRDDLSVAKET